MNFNVKSRSNSRYALGNPSGIGINGSVHPNKIPKRHFQHLNNTEKKKLMPLVQRFRDDDLFVGYHEKCSYFSLLYTDFNNNILSTTQAKSKLHIPIHRVRAVGTCNGVVYLEDPSGNGEAILWNPYSFEYKFLLGTCILPHPPTGFFDFFCSGFGFDALSQDYRVIRFVKVVENQSRSSNVASHAVLYSLKSDSWEEIPNHLLPRITPDAGISAYVDGVFYWYGRGDSDDAIISYNFASRQFSSFAIPPPGRTRSYSIRLVEWDGRLAAITYPGGRTRKKTFILSVWDDGELSWTLVSTFSVPCALRPLGFASRDQLLFEGNRFLRLFNLGTGKVKRLCIRDDENTLDFVACEYNKVQLNGI